MGRGCLTTRCTCPHAGRAPVLGGGIRVRQVSGGVRRTSDQMGKIHFTLTARFNVSLIMATALVALGLLLFLRPRPVLPVAIGLAAGVATGVLQRISVRSSRSDFARSHTAIEVRRAFMSNRPGKLSIGLLWATGVV